MNYVVSNKDRRNRGPIITRQREEELLHLRKLYTDRMEVIHLRALGIQQHRPSPLMQYDELQQRQLHSILKHNSTSPPLKKNKRIRSTKKLHPGSTQKSISLGREDDTTTLDDNSLESLLLSNASLEDRNVEDYRSIDKNIDKSPSIRSKKCFVPEVKLGNARRYSVEMKPSNNTAITSDTKKKRWGCCWLCPTDSNDGKDVQFGTKVYVVEIPNRFDYSNEQKYQMWPDLNEYHDMTEHIKDEIRWEQDRNYTDAIEEEQYYQYDGKFIHPALVPLSSSSSTTTTEEQKQFPIQSIVAQLDDKSNPQAPSIESTNDFDLLIV